MTYLAVLLQEAGHSVQVLVYQKADFFRSHLNRRGILAECVLASRGLPRMLTLRRQLRAKKADAVIAYLTAPCLYAELSALPWCSFRLIVSERNMEEGTISWRGHLRFLVHGLADAVVANSYTQTDVIRRSAPWLRCKLHTIMNCVDLSRFAPRSPEPPVADGPLRLLTLASLIPRKNPHGLLQALALIRRRRPDLDVELDWYGNALKTSRGYAALSEYPSLHQHIDALSLLPSFRIHDPVDEVVPLYHRTSAVVLPSLREGCPNIVCEAMACGKPVLASRIGDIPRLVEDGINGFLFDPLSPESIADALERFADLPLGERWAMGGRNRAKAERLFGFAAFCASYERLLTGVDEVGQ